MITWLTQRFRSLFLHPAQGRIVSIDALRGLACLCMITYHMLFFSNREALLDLSPRSVFMETLGFCVQIPFVCCIGISLAFSKSSKTQLTTLIQRNLFIALCAGAMSWATYQVNPDCWVRFGLLHFALTARLVLSPFKSMAKISLFLGIGIYAYYLAMQLWAPEVMDFWLMMFGYPIHHTCFLDFFPVIPWMGLSFIGIFIGITFKNVLQTITLPTFPSGLLWLGRNSLLVYLAHIPIIFFGLKLIALI